MTFAFSVAGPSRLPAQTVARCGRRLARRQASADAASTARSANDDSPSPPIEDKESKASRKKEKELWATHDGYIRWLKTDAGKFRNVTKGEKVSWLGGAVVSARAQQCSPSLLICSPTVQTLHSSPSRHLGTTRKSISSVSFPGKTGPSLRSPNNSMSRKPESQQYGS